MTNGPVKNEQNCFYQELFLEGREKGRGKMRMNGGQDAGLEGSFDIFTLCVIYNVKQIEPFLEKL